MRGEWWERVERRRVLSFLMPPIMAYYLNLINDDHLGATAMSHVAALELVILALMRFLVFEKHSTVVSEYRDPRICQGGSGVITPSPIVVRRRVDHYGFSQSVSGCAFDSAAAYLAYQRSAEISWSSICPVNDGLRISLLNVRSIGYLSPKSRRIRTPRLSTFHLLKCSLRM